MLFLTILAYPLALFFWVYGIYFILKRRRRVWLDDHTNEICALKCCFTAFVFTVWIILFHLGKL